MQITLSPTQAKRLLEWGTGTRRGRDNWASYSGTRMLPSSAIGGWPIQAVFWLEWVRSGFADQQVNVLGHHYVTVNTKTETQPNPLQRGFKNSSGCRLCEKRTATIARERHEMAVRGFVKSFQSGRHKVSLRSESSHSSQPVRLRSGWA